MKKLIIGGLFSVLVLGSFHACKPGESVDAEWEDLITITALDYIHENDSVYSSFLSVLQAGELEMTLSAYNPDGDGYTVFLPDNKAMDEFITNSEKYSSLEELIADEDFARAFGRYHVVNLGLKADEFPFGALPDYTLSGDVLTVSFIIEEDTSYHKINNQAAVSIPDIEVSNGWVHGLASALLPVTKTTLEWLQENDDYSIFLDAVELTNFGDVLNVNPREDEDVQLVTLAVEPNSVYEKRGILNIDSLISFLDPADTDYTNKGNALNGFVGYHIMEESRFLDDFSENASNYTTFSEVPVLINGLELDIKINPGKEVFDTIVSGTDTTIVDYILFDIDNSNVLTQSGSIHFMDQVLTQQVPSIATQTFEFWDEPLITEYREAPGDYLIEDTASLRNITWSGAELYWIETKDDEHPAWNGDYFYMNGDFSYTYYLPKLVQGTYLVRFRAENVKEDNALVEVFIDGKKIGGLIDLSKGTNTSYPFQWQDLGSISFVKYEDHEMEIRSLIPGEFSLDVIQFTPYTAE